MSDQAKLHSVLPRRQTTLGEVATFNSGYRNSQDAVESGEYPFFTCSREVLRHTEFDFDAEAVIMAGNNADARFHLQYYKGKFAARQRTYVITPATPDVDCRYLYFAMHQLQPLFAAQAQGTTTKFVTIGMLRSAPIELPEIGTQRAIAHILGTLNDKIELNRRMNETLEAMARAIFKSWFVDFDPVRAKASGEPPESICRRLGLTPELLALFPDSFQNSELGEIPEGWSVGTFINCCARIESGGTPSRSVAEYWDGDIQWLTSGEVRDVIVFDTKEKITDAGLSASSAKLWPIGTTVVAMYGATAGQVCLLAEEMTANQACCALIPKPELVSFVFLTARASITQLSDKASGSAQQNLNKSLVANHQLILPPPKIADEFERVVASLFDQWILNQRECVSLGAVRDSLLPRLLSGDLLLNSCERVCEYA